ncbi:MAG TPA: endo alpha-1,4 polygalactosaminidase [Trebonia sp.]|nr:endo alpha-1,4 polygalactosaminidase [Trebonia sp.]
MQGSKPSGGRRWRDSNAVVALLVGLAVVVAVVVAALLVTAPGAGGSAGKQAGPAALAGSEPAGVLTASATGRPPAAAARTLPAPVRCRSCWRPRLQESWQIELSATPGPPYLRVRMIDLDGFDTPAATVAALHRSLPGRGVVCYIDAGTWENWRPDAGRFPRALLGRSDGWPGERWLDIAGYQGALAAIMRARVRMCKAKGFNAVDFDNVDGYANRTGFPLTAGDQLRYDAFLANLAHQFGLSAALKNDEEQIPVLLGYFDFAIDEQCFQYAECTTAQNGGYGLDEFTRAGKAVFDIEYDLKLSQFCPAAKRDRFNALRKHPSVGAWRQACPASG